MTWEKKIQISSDKAGFFVDNYLILILFIKKYFIINKN